MTDHNPYPEINEDADLAAELLGAAVARANGHPDASEAIGRMLEQVDGNTNTNTFGFMNGWVNAAALIAPLPEGTVARANQEPRLDTRWDLGVAEPGAAIGFRIFAALANRDLDTATALWNTAVGADDAEVHEMALVSVLHRAALIISRNLPEAAL